MEYFELVTELLLIVWAIVLCMIMPQYKAKSRSTIICIGIILVISLFILNSVGYRKAIFRYCYGYITTFAKMLWLFSVIDISFRFLLYTYLFVTSMKIHSKLLNSVIAVLGILNVTVWIVERKQSISAGLSGFLGLYDEGILFALRCVVPFLALTIMIVLLVVLKYDKGYQNPNKLQANIQPTNVCPNCGSPISDTVKYCTKCGTPLNNK